MIHWRIWFATKWTANLVVHLVVQIFTPTDRHPSLGRFKNGKKPLIGSRPWVGYLA
jgi:hypothetical protein